MTDHHDDQGAARAQDPAQGAARAQDPGTFRVLSRREALTLIGMAGVALVPACASGKSPSAGSAATSTTAVGSSAGASTSVAPQTAACVLAREATEGPFYLDIDKVRSDITEGRPGAPLELQITIVAADGCAPITDAAVDIWHTDAGGLYSGVGQSRAGPERPSERSGGADGQTFLRGTQLSDANGLTTFRTIYPGWYMGRAVHIHTKVHVSGAEGPSGPQSGVVVHTGQLFFDDDFTKNVYQAAPYSARPGPDQTNAEDGIYRSAGAASAVVPVVAQGNGYVGRIVLGVRQAGTANQA